MVTKEHADESAFIMAAHGTENGRRNIRNLWRNRNIKCFFQKRSGKKRLRLYERRAVCHLSWMGRVSASLCLANL
jgi:hypothetical protein